MANTLIYLCDDDDLFLKTALHNLSQNKSFTIKTFTTGEDLLKALSKKPAVVILDYFLDSEKPNAMTGIKVLQEIKHIAPDVEVIMLSGQEDIDVAVNSVKYGAVDYVVKNKSAFIRVQNDIKRVVKSNEKDNDQKSFRKFIMILIAFLVGLVIFLIIYAFDHTVFGLFPDPGSDANKTEQVEVVLPE
ncbi:MAG: response regulator [Flavobacteriales bacterium]